MLYCSKKRSSCGGGLRNVGVYVYVNPFRYFLDEREVETLAETLARYAGYRFVPAGAPPARPVIATVTAQAAPLIEVLRDTGLQAGGAATLVVNANDRTVRLDWPAPGKEVT